MERKLKTPCSLAFFLMGEVLGYSKVRLSVSHAFFYILHTGGSPEVIQTGAVHKIFFSLCLWDMLGSLSCRLSERYIYIYWVVPLPSNSGK